MRGVKMRESKGENGVRTVSSTDEIKPSRRKRMIEIKFKKKRKRKLHREKYEKVTRITSTYSRNKEEVWRDLIEKSKQMRYEEDFKKINRNQGIKRKRDVEKQEEKMSGSSGKSRTEMEKSYLVSDTLGNYGGGRKCVGGRGREVLN